MVFPNLGIQNEVNLSNDIGHPGFDDLKAVPLQIILDIVIRPRMEVQKILAHDQNLRPAVTAVIPHLFQDINRFGKAPLRTADAMLLQAVNKRVHSLFKGGVGTPRLQFIRPDLPQQFLHRIGSSAALWQCAAMREGSFEIPGADYDNLHHH